MRHGRTLWNFSRKFQGHSDIELSDEGRAETRALARALGREPFDFAVASDLRRAHDTALAIVGSRIPVTLDARWREFAFGEWEGLTWEEIVERWPHLREQSSSAAKAYRPEGGESFEQVVGRVREALEDLTGGTHRNVLVVTHAGALHAMLEVLFNGEAPGVRFLPACVTHVRMVDGQARLLRLNDVAHLDPV